jgi:hypothetical protein
MINSIQVKNHFGEVVNIELRSPEKSGFLIRKLDGLGPTKSLINTSESLYGDGGFFNSARLSQRNLVFDIVLFETATETIEDLRNKTYRFFPMKNEIEVRVETDTRVGVINGYVESNDPDIFSKQESTQISLLCPNPFFRGEEIIQTTFSGVESGFEFPWENPSLTLPLIEFGLVFIESEANVFYSGDTPTGVVIYINFLGPVNDLIVHNASSSQDMAISSDKLIELTGSDFIAGDIVIISTVRGSKFIYLLRGNETINILNTIDIFSDWFEIGRGDNVFTYTADSGVNNLQFLIQHQLIYEGL